MKLTAVNRPTVLRDDDNIGNVYAVVTGDGLQGYVYRVPSSRSWIAIYADGKLTGIDAATRRHAADLFLQKIGKW